MKKIASRFGEIEYDENNLLHFPEGLIGLATLHDFVVMPNLKQGPLFWIQSTEDPAMAFVLTDPTNFFLGYTVVPDATDLSLLGITEKDECYCVVIVTVPENQNITLNMAAPILYSPKSNRAIQVIVDDPKGEWQTKTPLPKFEAKQK